MRRNASAVLAASLLFGVSGCLMPVGIAYPTLSYTPNIALSDDAAHEVHAFRVDCAEARHAQKAADRLKCQFREIELAERNGVPGQMATGVSYYWAMFLVPGGTNAFPGTAHARDTWVRVRLYRRGCNTIEIGSDSSSKTPPPWEVAESYLEQEQAIDELVGVKKDSLAHLLPGTQSKMHEAFLRFAAIEYHQLGSRLDENDAEQRRMRTRIFKKYNRLMELATKGTISSSPNASAPIAQSEPGEREAASGK